MRFSFLILPTTFDTDAQLRVSKVALGIFGVALLAAGFLLTGLVCFACRNWIFQADCVFVPCLTSCTLGLLTVFYCFVTSKRYIWNLAAYLVVIGAAISMLIYAALLALSYRKIAAVRKNPVRDTIEIPLAERLPSLSLASPAPSSYHDQMFFTNHYANMYPTARGVVPSDPKDQTAYADPRVLQQQPQDAISEGDLLRQQMLMLLNTKHPSHHLNTDPAANTFNRIDFTPTDDDDDEIEQGSGTKYYGRQGPGFSRHSSQYSWQGSTLQPWDGVWRDPSASSSTMGTMGTTPAVVRREDSAARREERRREIEQGG